MTDLCSLPSKPRQVLAQLLAHPQRLKGRALCLSPLTLSLDPERSQSRTASISLARLVISSRRGKLSIRAFVNDGPLMIVKSILSGLMARSTHKLTVPGPCLLCLRLRITQSLCLTTGATILQLFLWHHSRFTLNRRYSSGTNVWPI